MIQFDEVQYYFTSTVLVNYLHIAIVGRVKNKLKNKIMYSHLFILLFIVQSINESGIAP